MRPQLSARPVDQTLAEWTVVSRSAASYEAVALLRSAEPLVAGVVGEDSHLGDLVEALRRPADAAQRERAAQVVRVLLRSAGLHPLIPRTLLQCLVPGLVNVARRLGWGAGGDWQGSDQFLADVMATAWEVVASWTGQDRPYAVLDLLSATRCRMRRQLAKQVEEQRRHFALALAES